MWPAPRVGADGARERPGRPGPEGPGTCFAEVWRKFDSFAHIPRLCRVLRSHGVRGGPRCPLHGWADGRHWRVLTGLGVCLPPSVARTSQSPLFPRDLILTNRTCDDPRSECGRILRCRG